MNVISVTGKSWIFKTFDQKEQTFLKDNFYLDETLSKLISMRKIKKEDLDSYLNPLIKNIIPNPEVLKDMNKSVLRITKAIINNEKVGIFGDYDVDGASSSALLGNFFKNINVEYEIYIPDRKKEGYGPSINGFKKLIESECKTILTVDCGTMSFEPIQFANDKNIDVIVLDHHQSELKLPNAFSIINPNQFEDSSNLNYLCAAGVCFMFLVALNKNLRNIEWFSTKKIIEPNLINFLDLVSLGTICDVVPLIGLNRAFVKQGLKILNLKKNLGLKTLLDMCKIETKASAYHLGYILGPRINAGGRVGKCSHGVNLLVNSNPKEVFKIATDLDSFNKHRQNLEKELLNDVLNEAQRMIKDPILILSGKGWHEGIIGIVASRIKERFNKPAIIISVSNNIGKASARSIVNFDIGSLIISAVQKGILVKGGGHKMAGGFTIDMRKINELKDFFFRKFKTINQDISGQPNIFIDSQISSSALNLDFFNKIDILSPFGSGNPEPKFLIEEVKTLKTYIVGDKHIKNLLLAKNGSTFQAIAFNAVDSQLSAYLSEKNKKTFNIVGKMSLNEWKGKKNVEFIIDDISVIKNLKSTVPSSIG